MKVDPAAERPRSAASPSRPFPAKRFETPH
jgi:hypothetical protein